jgi:hypothetical protein
MFLAIDASLMRRAFMSTNLGDSHYPELLFDAGIPFPLIRK